MHIGPVGPTCCRWRAWHLDGEQGAKGDVRRSAAVEAEDELVEIGLQVFPAQPVIEGMSLLMLKS